MGKKAVILSKEKKAIAIANGLSLQTVYARIKRGWEVSKAITEKPSVIASQKLKRQETGEFKPSNNPTGKIRHFTINKYLDDKLDQLIEYSGMNQSNFIAKIVEDYIHEQSKVI